MIDAASSALEINIEDRTFFVRIEKYDLRRTSFSKVRLAHSNADGFFIFRIEFNLCDKLIEKRYNNCFLIVI